MMKQIGLLLILALCVVLSCNPKREGKPRVLVFSKTAGFKHSSIPTGMTAIRKLGAENGFDVDTTRNANYFVDDSLQRYSAVIFLSTTENVLDYRQESAFERYIQAGGGFVGIHAATDTEYDWGWYGRLVGAYFTSHPRPQQAKFVIRDKNFPATSFFKDSLWVRTDELYNFKKINPDVHVLITIDESSYEGGSNGSFHPMSWYHEYDGGRAFYTELGHTDESYAEENYLKHLLGGIQYAIGENRRLDYDKARTQLPPDENRFTKTQLASGGEFYEPTEMTVLPNLDILVVQRRGQVLLYKNATQKVKQVGQLNVYHKTKVSGVNAEEGLMGLSKDPDFEKNHFVYMFYAPVDTSVNRLSRFTFVNDTLDLKTEKTILEVKSTREICCHTGGSIAFGPGRMLFLSTGDNSTPFDEPKAKYVNSGYGPMNDLPGKQQYDARRSSGNTNDLRGKILRIHLNEDGTYDIPEGNLFAKGADKTRPEIYVMGNRNPYRISVDPKNSNLYWGEVGPDANQDSLDTRGPRGYDELNQARKAGYFGWPLFVGNNFPYRAYDYATGKHGDPFDPNKPLNTSKNNTGLTELPALSPAFIWYPYGPSHDFPQLGTGGRNAMAGPVYYTDMYPKETRLPDYYNGKVIISDWIRGWVKAVTLQPNGDFDKMEPFFPGLKGNSMIDMEVGPDGRLYVLEYGSGWFTKNPDAGIARIDFNGGNRAPKIKSVSTNRATGVLPFAVKATVDAEDPEHDKLHYVWNLGNGETKETTQPTIDYTYTKAGDFNISVDVKDPQGESTQGTVSVYAGNETPEVTVTQTEGNRSFFLPGYPLKYKVAVKDEKDTSKFLSSNLYVSADFVDGTDRADTPMGHQQGVSGRALMLSLDCKSCHKENEKSIGPSFVQVSNKYKGDAKATDYLVGKIISGGKGVWGEVAMPAHAGLSNADVSHIVSWITTLANPSLVKKSLPQEGSFTVPSDAKNTALLVISANYTDQGGNNIKALTGNGELLLKGSLILFSGKEKSSGFKSLTYNGTNLMMFPKTDGWFGLNEADFTGVRSLKILGMWQNMPVIPTFEIRLDAPDGKLLGSGKLNVVTGKNGGSAQIAISPVTGNHTLFVVCRIKSSVDIMGGVTGVELSAR